MNAAMHTVVSATGNAEILERCSRDNATRKQDSTPAAVYTHAPTVKGLSFSVVLRVTATLADQNARAAMPQHVPIQRSADGDFMAKSLSLAAGETITGCESSDSSCSTS